MTARARHRLGVAGAFASAAGCYWLRVFPLVRQELRYWRARAASIPDPVLRRLALETYSSKWCNLEGAAAFATLVPAAYRRNAVRLLVSFQAAYDYADTLSERPRPDPVANARQLHQPLLVALQPGAEHPDYYLHNDRHADGGYMRAFTDACRDAFERMPSQTLVADAAKRAAERIVAYQSLNHPGEQTQAALERWSALQTPHGTGLRWWETSAACASSLTALALLSAAANPALTVADVAAIEHAYHPWIGALHTLLDSLIDWRDDELAGYPSLLDHAASICELAERMGSLARRSRQMAAALGAGRRHEIVLAGMASVYLTAPQAHAATVAEVAGSVRQELGAAMPPALLVVGARRRAMWIKRH